MPTYYVLQYHVALASGMISHDVPSPRLLGLASRSRRVSSVVLRTPYEDWIKIGVMEHMMCFFFILTYEYLKKDTALEFSSILTCSIFLLAEQFKPQAV